MAVNLTREGFEKLQKEIIYLKSVRRLEVADALETARLKGDLRENAEYDAAKDEQAHLENRIAQLEKTLMAVRIIDDEDIDASKAFLGATLTLKDLNKDTEFVYKLVSKEEANLKEKKISVESPIGQALVGKEKDAVVEVQIPAGKLKFQIMKIER